MAVRATLVVLATLAAGCGLVSGLDGLKVDDGGTSNADSGGSDASTETIVAVDAIDDVTPPPMDGSVDAGRAGTALQTNAACSPATGAATLSLSNGNFTISALAPRRRAEPRRETTHPWPREAVRPRSPGGRSP